MKVLAAPMFALALALAVPAVAQAAEPPLPSLVLISDVNIFDGTSDTLHEEEQVGDTIECVQVSSLKLVVRQISCREEEGSRVKK